MLTPPVDQQAIQAGFSLLADIGSLGIEYCTNGVGTTRDYLAKNHDLLIAVLKAIVQGVHRFKTDQSFGEGVVERWTKVDDPAIITASWKPYAARYLQNKLYVTDAGIQTVLDELSATDSPRRRPIRRPTTTTACCRASTLLASSRQSGYRRCQLI